MVHIFADPSSRVQAHADEKYAAEQLPPAYLAASNSHVLLVNLVSEGLHAIPGIVVAIGAPAFS